ncbi:hypothetical protein CapIbe_013465, partial [Capra ibex]
WELNVSPVGAFMRGSWGQFPCRNAQLRPPPPPGTNTLGFPAGIPERRPSPSPVHLRGPVASTLGAPEQRRSPPSGRQGVSGPDSPPSPSVSPGRPAPPQAQLQRRPPAHLHPPARPVPTPGTRRGRPHAPRKGRGGECSVIAVRTASSGTRSAWHTHGLHAVAAGAVFPHLRPHPALSVKDAGPRPRAQPRPGAPRPLPAECAPAGPAPAQPLPRRPPRCSCLEDPGDRRACGLRSIGPHSRVRLSDSALTSLSAETPCKGVQRLER